MNNMIAVIRHIERIVDTSRVLSSIKEKAQHLLKSLYSAHSAGNKMELNAMRSEVDENDVVDEAVVRRKPNRKRLRSRNSVIDEWLSYEAGEDSYADLEDFLVE